jgi:uncharacterized protein YkwD
MIPRPILMAALAMLAAPAGAQPAQAPSLEEQVLAGINEARTNPSAYAAKLREYRGYFDGNVVLLPGSDVGLRTREGTAAVDEAIAFLSRQAPLAAIRSAPNLTEAAKEYAAEQALNGTMGHIGADGSDSKARIKKHGASGFMAEALSYGATDPAAIVRQLIVDDGAPGRPNRKILLDKKYFRSGIACTGHPAARMVCVIDLSSFATLPPPKQVRNPPPEIDVF